MAEDIGNMGPHPDIAPLMVQELEMLKPNRRLADSSVSILQQRTLPGLPKPFGGEGYETISVVLALSPAISGGDDVDHLVAYIARRDDDATEWESAGTLYKPFANTGSKPWTGAITIDARRGIAVGALVHHPDVAVQQIELPDGSVFEDRVTNNSVLIYAPLRSPERWSGEALIRMFTQDGRLIESAALPLHPTPPTAVAG